MKRYKGNRYGLEPLRSVREVAALMGISHTRVMQLEYSALSKLRRGLGVDDPDAANAKPWRSA